MQTITVGYFLATIASFTSLAKTNPTNSDKLLTMITSRKTPVVRFEPYFAEDGGLIHFNKARASTYSKYTEKMDNFTNMYYENEYSTVYCETDDNGYRLWDIPCWMETYAIAEECFYTDYGFEDGMPCVALYLDHLVGWLPEPYTNDTCPDKIRDRWSKHSITVLCEGTDPVSIDNLGPTKYSPPEGFNFHYFPYSGQPHRDPPVVYLQFTSTPGIVVNVRCSIWAQNIHRDDRLNTGTISFDLMID